MISKYELRLGNYIIYEAPTHIITGLKDTYCLSQWNRAGTIKDKYQHVYDAIDPIPLDDKEIRALGFIKSAESDFYRNYKYSNNFYLSLALKDEPNIGAKEGDVIYGENYDIINYVHQLQNVFAVRTNYKMELRYGGTKID
jgi:hypothetical protein